jgi:HTH-type transcriptional regulator / antitoxin HipB
MKKDDLEKYINKRKKSDSEFAGDFEEGYLNFKIGHLLRQYRLEAGLTLEEMAQRLNTHKSAISRIENHSEDIRYSTLMKYARAVNKQLLIQIV